MTKIIDLLLSLAAGVYALMVLLNTYLAETDGATSQRLGQMQEYLQQRVPQSKSMLQSLALRVNQSAQQSPALKQVLDNLQLHVSQGPASSTPGPMASPPPSPPQASSGTSTPSP